METSLALLVERWPEAGLGTIAWGGSWSPVSLTVNPLHLRIPLHKGKSLRNTLKERGLLEDFLRRHQYEFIEKGSNTGMVASEPLTNYLDVSVSAGLLRDEFSGS